jgi:hypothetical protein
LNAAADELSDMQLPYNRCAELSYCLLNLRTVLLELAADETILRNEQVDRIVNILNTATGAPEAAAHHVERMRRVVLFDVNEGMGRGGTVPESDERRIADELNKMKEAAGIFRGLAATITALKCDT